MKDIEAVLDEKYKLKRFDLGMNGPRCIVVQNDHMTGVVAKPYHFDTTGKWVVRFIPTILKMVPGGIRYFQLGAMVEERFDSKDDCVEYLNTQAANVYKKMYIYTLGVVSNMTKTVDELENLDPTNRGEFLEVLK